MKDLRGKRTSSSGDMLAVRVQFWRAKPWCALVRFQSKHVYGNVSNPFGFSIELLGTAGPAALESSALRIHLNDRGRGRRGQRPESFRRDREQKRGCISRHSLPPLSQIRATRRKVTVVRSGFKLKHWCGAHMIHVWLHCYIYRQTKKQLSKGD